MDILWLWCNRKNVMQLLIRVCSVDRVRTIQCSMQLTAARFRYLLHLNSIAAPQMGMYLIARCHSRRKTYFANIPNKVGHCHTHFSSDWSSKTDFSSLHWFMTVLSNAKHALHLNQKRFRQIDNEQYDSHTDFCTGYVQILYHHHHNVT